MQSDNNPKRLNKHLALVLGISRREADQIIEQGRATVNGNIVSLGARFDTSDIIKVDGKILDNKKDYQYIALNKPVGYVCSRRQQGDSPTIYDLLPANLHNLKPVGRLDRDSSGLILITNDGDFAYQMTHPKFYKVKVYQVTLNKDLEPLHQQMISDFGVTLDDGASKLSLERLRDDDRRNWTVTMHEGRNRQIRRTFAALGYNVVKLHRTDFGNYKIDDLESGKYIVINKT